MFKFTLSYANGMAITHTCDSYQAFLSSLVKSEAVSTKILAWLVEYKDLRADTQYSYWNNGCTVYLRKEKANA